MLWGEKASATMNNYLKLSDEFKDFITETSVRLGSLDHKMDVVIDKISRLTEEQIALEIRIDNLEKHRSYFLGAVATLSAVMSVALMFLNSHVDKLTQEVKDDNQQEQYFFNGPYGNPSAAPQYSGPGASQPNPKRGSDSPGPPSSNQVPER